MSLPPLWGNVPRALLKLFGLSGPEQRCPPLNIEKEIRARTDDTLSFLLSSSALSTLLHSSLCLSPSFFHDNRPYFSSGSFIFSSSSSDLYQLRISLEYESVRSLKRVKPRRFFSSQNSIVFSLDERKIDPCLFFFFGRRVPRHEKRKKDIRFREQGSSINGMKGTNGRFFTFFV